MDGWMMLEEAAAAKVDLCSERADELGAAHHKGGLSQLSLSGARMKKRVFPRRVVC